MQKAECVALGAAGHQRPRVGGQVHELHGGELRMRTHCLGHPWSELRQVQLVYDVLRYSPMAIRHLLGTSASVVDFSAGAWAVGVNLSSIQLRMKREDRRFLWW